MNDLINYNCKISENLVKVNYEVENISVEEQEFTMTAYRDEEMFDVSCSDRIFMLKLFKSKFFTIESVFVNSDGFILQVNGKLLKKSITIRTKEVILTEEQKRSNIERLRKYQEEKK